MMMTNQHPITPPPELVQQWIDANKTWLRGIAIEAAQWGADQELEACRDWLFLNGYGEAATISKLIAARRPKPPSLKEQALAVLDDSANRLDGAHENIIRRALEALPND